MSLNCGFFTSEGNYVATYKIKPLVMIHLSEKNTLLLALGLEGVIKLFDLQQMKLIKTIRMLQLEIEIEMIARSQIFTY